RSSLKHIILPATALSLGIMAQIMRLTRSSVIEQLNKDYILAAKSYGLPQNLITYTYILKNAFTSTLTILGLSYAFLLGNAFLVEVVFSWPGMAEYGVQGLLYKDYNSIVAVTLIVGIAFAFCNLIVDVLYRFIDPRIKFD